MKHILFPTSPRALRFVMLLGFLFCGICSIMADEVVVYTLDLSPANTSNDSYSTNYNVTSNGINWSIPGNQEFKGHVRIGGKNITNTDRVIKSNGVIPYEITRLVINHLGTSNSNLEVKSITLTVASDAAFSSVIETQNQNPTISASTSGSVTFTPTASEWPAKWPANSYYKLTFKITNSKSTNYGLDVANVEFYAQATPFIKFASSSVSLTYGDAFTKPEMTSFVSSAITYTSSTPSVASVDVEGNVTINSVGTTTITASADDVSDSYTITVNAPAALSEALSTVFKETFDGSTGGTVEANDFSGSAGDGTLKCDNTGWTLNNGYGAGVAAKFGSSANNGSARTPYISVTNGNTYKLRFKAAPWNEEEANMSVSVTGGEISGVSTANMKTKQWNDYEATIVASSSSLAITFQSSQNRFFLDEVQLLAPVNTVTASIPSSGFGTLCSIYPLNFSDDSEYKAWYVRTVRTDEDGGEVVLSQVTGSIKGGEPVILQGSTGSHDIPTADSENTLDGNLLLGTLAPTYIAAEEAYGLSSGIFKLINAGVMPANKAYMPASATSGNVKSMKLVFEDATGIINQVSIPAHDIIYNLQGVRLDRCRKSGLYIVNGKKKYIHI